MRISIAALILVTALGLGACTQGQSDTDARRAGYDAHNAAREAGIAAYKAAEKTKEAAGRAARELHEAGQQAHEGWQEAKHEDQAKKKP